MMMDICCDYFICALEYRKNLSEKFIWYGKWKGTEQYFLKEQVKNKISEVETEGRASNIYTVEGRKYMYCFWKFRNYGQNSILLVRVKKVPVDVEHLENILHQSYHKRATESFLF